MISARFTQFSVNMLTINAIVKQKLVDNCYMNHNIDGSALGTITVANYNSY